MNKFNVQIDSVDESYPCSSEQTLLMGMEKLGKRGIPVGCRGGGCGVCKVHITSGDFRCKKMSRAHVSADEEQQGHVLACRCHPLSDITLTVTGKMKAAVLRNEDRSSTTRGVEDGN